MKKALTNFYLQILWTLARLQLLKNKSLIVGITGSAGKSSCTHAMAVALGTKYKVKFTSKGNSETGIPFEILGIPVKNYLGLDWIKVILLGIWKLFSNWEKYEVFVVEMGIDSNQTPKDMNTLLKIIKPQIGVLLNANNVHLQYFTPPRNIQAVAKEKSKLLKSLPADGLAVFNGDQKEFDQLDQNIQATIKKFSLNKKSSSHIYLEEYKVDQKGTVFSFVINKKKYKLTFAKQLMFKESFGSLATVLLVADYLNIDLKQALKNLERKFKVLPGRGKVFAGIKNTTLIDSSYNSSLEPTSATLRMFSQIATKDQTKIAVLGDMRELGERAQKDHQDLAKVALKEADLVITVGPLTKEFFPDHKKIIKFENAKQALDFLTKEIKGGEIILFKGSQNTILLEIMVEGLLQNQKDSQKLCRRSKYWDQQRHKITA